MKRLFLLPVSLLLAAVAVPAQGNLELGKMWTFENPPLAYLKDEYGFAPNQEWFDALRMASLRYGSGCSASFVSPKGLIMTNHHCARGHLAQVSPDDQDWSKDGFYARALEDEVKVPGLTVQQLVRVVDITQRMQQGLRAADGEAESTRKLAANEKAVMDEAGQLHPGLQPQIVKLHQGAAYQLYLYKIWDDIRLVCAPHLQVAYFGGDPDNFTYPRYCLDFTFLRAWEGGKPADTARHYFRWSKIGAKQDELVFVTGNPGSTDRLKTVAQMETIRDVTYPIIRDLIDNRLAILREKAGESPAREKALRTQIFSLGNAEKAYAGYHGGLLDEAMMARKRAAEAEFRAKVHADAELKQRFGDVWDALAATAATRRELEPKQRFYSAGGSPHLTRALLIVEATTDDGPGAKAAAQRARDTKVAWTDVQQAFCVDHFERALGRLPADDPMRGMVGDRGAAAFVAGLARSKVSDQAFVDALLEGGAEPVRASDDPAIAAARALWPLQARVRTESAALTARETRAGARLGQALFEVYGNKVSPDATFTLRFSDGRVQGFPFNGTIAPWRTSFYGLYGRNTAFDGKPPFDLPEIWIDRRDQIDLTTAMNFVSTNDIIGGNSGSPMVNRDLEVVGLIFDGNIEMLPNRFVYSDAVARSVSVHATAIVESLVKVYEADRLVVELRASGGE